MDIASLIINFINHTAGFSKIILTTIATVFGGGLIVHHEQKKKEERNSLDLLLVSTHRYLHYLLSLRRQLLLKSAFLKNYIANPNDEVNLEQAFCTMSVIPNFQIDITKYDFTINTKPCIVDDILLYQQMYKEIEKGFELLNNVSANNVNPANQQETVILAQKLLSPNWHIHILLSFIGKSAYLLNRIRCKVIDYKLLYKNRFKHSLGLNMTDEAQKEINDIISFLEKLDDQSWKECLNDLEPIGFGYLFKKFYQRILSFTNEGNHKKVCILGFKIKFRREKTL